MNNRFAKLINPFDVPRAKARGLLRVDTESGVFFPRPKGRGLSAAECIKIICLAAFLFGAFSNISQADEKEDELFFVSQKAFEDGFYDVALRYLSKFLKDFPDTQRRPQVNLLMGQCYFFDNQFLKAFDTFQALLNSADSRDIKDAVLFWMGETYLKGRDLKQSQVLYQKLINEFPKSTYLASAYYSLAWAFFEDGLFQQSLENFTKLVKDFKHSNLVEDANFKIGECLYNLKEYEKSKSQFSQYVGNFPQSRKLDLAYFYIAEADYYLDDLNSALEYYSKAISMSSDDKMKSLAKISSGWALLKLKKYDEALKCFDEAERLSREKGLAADDILLGKANLFSQLDQFEKAKTTYEELIKSYPVSLRLPDAYLGLANALYSLNNYKESAAVYKTILEKFKENSQLNEKAYFGLAWTNLKLGNSSEAIDNFKFVADNSLDKMMRLSALCQMADAYQDTGNLFLSQDIYDKILKEYPESPYSDYVQYQLGIVLLKMDRFDAATLMFQSLKQNFPKSKFITEAQYYLGTAFFKKGDFVSAVEQLSSLIKALARDSELRSEAMFDLGLSYSHLEKYREAIEIFERIAKEYPLSADLIQRSEFEVANTVFNQGKAKEAIKKFKILIYKYPKTKTAQLAMNWLGHNYFKEKEFDTSIKYFREIAEQFSESDFVNEAYYNTAKALIEKGNFSEAAKELEKVNLQTDRELSVKTRLAKALILSKTNALAAVKDYQKIADEFPDYAKSAVLRLAQAYKSLNDADRAISFFQASLTKPGDNLVELSDAQIQFEIADLQESKGDLNKAVEGYLKIPYLYPTDDFWVVKSYLRAARIFEDKNDWKEAKKIYEKLAAQDFEEAKFAKERLDWINKNLSRQ